MENLQGAIHKFYSQVKLHREKIEEINKKALKPCSSILNQSALLRAVIPEDSLQGTAFINFPGFRDSLLNSVWNSLEKELPLLNQIREEIQAANEELSRKQQALETTYQDLKTNNQLDLTVVNPSSPSFEHIIDWSVNIWRYYYSYYLQVSQAVKTLNIKDETSVSALLDSFKEDLNLKEHINEILAYQLNVFEFLNF